MQLNSTYEQAKGIWELEEGCIDIQSGEEKKKMKKNEFSATKPVLQQTLKELLYMKKKNSQLETRKL